MENKKANVRTNVRSLTRFGTYGFLSLMLAAQIAGNPTLAKRIAKDSKANVAHPANQAAA
jgi:hypothetical protein